MLRIEGPPRLSLVRVAAVGLMTLTVSAACKQEPLAPAAITLAPAPKPERQLEGPRGSISGEVIFEGTPQAPAALNRNSDSFCARAKEGAIDDSVLVDERKLANAVVRISSGASPASGSGRVPIEQVGCSYRPRIQAARVGQSLSIKNGDRTLHNVHAYRDAITLFNRAQPANAPVLDEPLSTAGVIRLKCDVHPWMAAFVVVSDHPFIAVTDAKGAFTLKDVPPGTYTLEAWHEKLGRQAAQIKVDPGQPATVGFRFTSK